MRIIISGGGTGGHIYPAIAVADCISRRDPDAEILFVGAQGRMEMEKVPAAGYRIEGLWITGLQRKLSLKNLGFPFRLLSSLIRARKIVRRFKPDAAIGFGGFASGPTLYVAAKKGIPTMIQEQNSWAGITNKLLGRWADRICVAYDDMDRFFPQGKIIKTGNPVRKDLLDIASGREEAVRYFGLDPARKTLLCVGGSLGARTLNITMEKAHALLAVRDDIQVLWQIGKLYEATFGKSATAMLDHVHPMTFIDRMDLAYSVADSVICRAGALTISELCLVGKPAILVPSPNVAEDHQTKNAMALVGQGAAMMVPDMEAPERLVPMALDLLDDSVKQAKMAEKIRARAMPNADETIVDTLTELVRKIPAHAN